MNNIAENLKNIWAACAGTRKPRLVLRLGLAFEN